MPGVPGMGRGKKAKGKGQAKPGKKGGKSRSGNPAKRAQEQRAVAARQSGDGAPLDLPEDFELPSELKNLLPPGQR
jgi:signal recognition particle subunit SRP54